MKHPGNGSVCRKPLQDGDTGGGAAEPQRRPWVSRSGGSEHAGQESTGCLARGPPGSSMSAKVSCTVLRTGTGSDPRTESAATKGSGRVWSVKRFALFDLGSPCRRPQEEVMLLWGSHREPTPAVSQSRHSFGVGGRCPGPLTEEEAFGLGQRLTSPR